MAQKIAKKITNLNSKKLYEKKAVRCSLLSDNVLQCF